MDKIQTNHKPVGNDKFLMLCPLCKEHFMTFKKDKNSGCYDLEKTCQGDCKWSKI